MKKRMTVLFLITLFTCILMYPYLIRDFLPIEHDTFFHVSRIENLSLAIREGDFLPAVYPYENMGFGYASPLFYSDVLLIIPALMHIAGLALTTCYKTAVFAAVWVSAYTMCRFAERVCGKTTVSLMASAAYLFTNYRITDVFVRGALGEIFALAFLPVVLSGMYEILCRKNTDAWKLLAAGLCLLALSHNLTFLFGSILCAVLFVIFIQQVSRDTFITLCRGVGTAFLLTAFFTLPMIEQLKSQNLFVSGYNGTSLASYAMTWQQYLVNTTVFGLAGNNRPLDQTMIENIGYFLTFAPAGYFFLNKEKKNPFLTALTITGYICFLLPSALLPWDHMQFLGVMQFPWRFNTMAILLLSVPAALAADSFLKKPVLKLLLVIILSGECIWHVYPVLGRTFGMDSHMTWQDVLDGKLCDPCYSAFYVRVELAGGDYLPVTSPDYRTQTRKITLKDGTETDIAYRQSGTSMTFSIDSGEETYILPLTWYKGYQVYRYDGTRMKRLAAVPSAHGLVSFRADGKGQYICMYGNTLLRTVNMSLSAMTLALLVLNEYRKKYMKDKKQSV